MRLSEINREYKREGIHYYIVIEQEVENQLELKMLSRNQPKNLLPIEVRTQDGKTHFYYNITNKKSLKKMIEKEALSYIEIKTLFENIFETIEMTKEYLLEADSLLFEEETIYKSEQYRFIYLPGKKNNIVKQIQSLVLSLMDKIDYQDQEAVVYIYGLYRIIREGNFDIDALKDLQYKKEQNPYNQIMEEHRRRKDEMEDMVNQQEMRKSEYANLERQELGYKKLERENLEHKKFGRKKSGNKRQEDLDSENSPYKMSSRGLKQEKRVRENQRVQEKGVGKNQRAQERAAGESQRRREKATGKNQREPRRAAENHFGFLLWLPLLFLSLLLAYEGYYMYGKAISIEIQILCIITFFGFVLYLIGLFWWIRGKREKKKVDKLFSNLERQSETMYSNETTFLDGAYAERKLAKLSPVSEMEGNPIIITKEKFTIGNMLGNADGKIDKRQISRTHARIEKKENKFFIKDLKSTNGTSVNGIFLKEDESIRIKDGDEIEFGDCAYFFKSIE